MERIVLVVDDDDAVRQAMVALLESSGYAVRAFASAADFLREPLPVITACLILDMEMPDIDGFGVVAALAEKRAALPVIFVTGHGSIPLSVQAMKAGAMEFLTKPLDPPQLLRAVEVALEADSRNLAARCELAELTVRHSSLTPRERQVFGLIIGGLLNKQVAGELGVSEITAKVHKKNVMDKMRTRTLVDLARVAERLHIMKARSR
jgi:FixJ family two-component response regulator